MINSQMYSFNSTAGISSTLLSGEVTKQNEGKRSVLPHCHRQDGFKHLVQEIPNGKEHHKRNHEKHKIELTAEGFVSREEFDQP